MFAFFLLLFGLRGEFNAPLMCFRRGSVTSCALHNKSDRSPVGGTEEEAETQDAAAQRFSLFRQRDDDRRATQTQTAETSEEETRQRPHTEARD